MDGRLRLGADDAILVGAADQHVLGMRPAGIARCACAICAIKCFDTPDEILAVDFATPGHQPRLFIGAAGEMLRVGEPRHPVPRAIAVEVERGHGGGRY